MHPIRHVLLATDLTDRSGFALQKVVELSRYGSLARLTVLHVIAPNLPTAVTNAQRGAAEAVLADQMARGDVAANSRDVVISIGDAFGTIIGEAFTRRADLIVIGQPGRRRYAHVFMGTTAELVIRFADRPVLMVKRLPEDPYRRVLVAFDGSEGSVRALDAALAIASDAEFRIVHAWWPPRVALGAIDATRQAIARDKTRLRSMIDKSAKEAVAPSQHPSPRIVVDMIEDNPYTVLTNQSSWADLLVMGTHSKGRLASTVSTGKLAQHLLVESTCDVLTSRP